MSNYATKARHKETGEIVTVNCYDNYFSAYAWSGRYGYDVPGVGILDRDQFYETYEEIRDND